MARKTFISYKYSDVVEGKDNNLRDRIIKKFGDDSRFYRGEDGYSMVKIIDILAFTPECK